MAEGWSTRAGSHYLREHGLGAGLKQLARKRKRLPTPVGTRRNWAMQTATSAAPLCANGSADDYSCQIKSGQPMACQLEYGVH